MAEETQDRGAAGTSKQVIRRLRLTGDLIASLKVHEEEIAEALGEILLP